MKGLGEEAAASYFLSIIRFGSAFDGIYNLLEVQFSIFKISFQVCAVQDVHCLNISAYLVFF